MKDEISNIRGRRILPKLVDELAAMGNEIDEMLSGDVFVRWAYTFRSFAEQNEMYAQGRTKLFDVRGTRLGIVTNARGGQSYHNFGLAVDIVLIDGKNASWDTAKDWDGDGMADWLECVRVFKRHGWEWGGDFKSLKDKPHFQKTFGHSCSELLNLVDKKSGYPQI